VLIEQGLRERLAKAKLAVADAVRRAPTSVDVVRSQVDLLRLDGNLTQARTMVNALSARASDPDNAYSLGALDLAEGPSGYPSAIERLRVAARSEESLARARPLLIYALSTTDPAAAGAELDKLSAVAPTHRSLPVLRALVELQKAKLAPPEPEPPVRKPPPPPAAAAAPATPRPPSAESVAKGTLAKATEARETGDLDTAEGLYQAVLQRTPSSIPALSGLGDIARQRHANATAAAYYDQILKQDRNHVPTLMARGDMYWEGGNRILAVALYRRALGQVGPSDPVGQRALRRIEEFDRAVAAIDSQSDSKGSEPPSTSTPGGEAPSGSESPAPSGEAPSGSESPAPEPNAPPEPAKPSGNEPSPSENSEPSPPATAPPKASAPSRSPAPRAPAEPGSGTPDEPAGAPAERP
jgi:tetratricopeptide (TPR) repeat protein